PFANGAHEIGFRGLLRHGENITLAGPPHDAAGLTACKATRWTLRVGYTFRRVLCLTPRVNCRAALRFGLVRGSKRKGSKRDAYLRIPRSAEVNASENAG